MKEVCYEGVVLVTPIRQFHCTVMYVGSSQVFRMFSTLKEGGWLLHCFSTGRASHTLVQMSLSYKV